jgi:UDP-N-acetylmuramoyl-tripeptide--D-alanyl-D-alanine ligase
MKNLTLRNITEACRGTYHGDAHLLDREVDGVTIDSRKVQAGYLFVAIDGVRVNAHKFIPDTIEKGALCVVSHEDLGDTDYPYILVESTGQALLDIAKLYRDSFDVKVVGITGSVGKTSTKEMIASVLAQKYNVHKTLGNFNNEWGLPITIFEMNESHQVAVLEMGVNHFGEMRRLSSVASPDICVITNIGVAHLEFFKSREGILQEKSQMIQDMKNGGTIILNGDDDLLAKMGPVKGVTPTLFGTSPEDPFYADHIQELGLAGTSCTIHLPDGNAFDCTVPLPGIHMVSNALAGTAVGYTLGLTPEEIKAGIESLPSIPGRNHIIKTDRLIILDDCYNANPISMKASIDVLDMAIGRKVAVLGDMGELGEDAEALHREVGAYAASKGIDLVCAIGPVSKALAEGAKAGEAVATDAVSDSATDIATDAASGSASDAVSAKSTQVLWFETKADFIAAMKDFILDGDNVLVKASHGMEFPELVEALQQLD